MNKSVKGRLLHYYPQIKFNTTGTNSSANNSSANDSACNNTYDSACAWHYDHGVLTVLTRAIYLDSDYNLQDEQDNLYIKDKNGHIIKATIPVNAVLCQIGEILQVLSGGYFKATPHCVQSCNKNFSRETFPVFT